MEPGQDKRDVVPDEIRAKLINSVDENWDSLMDALLDLATGVWVKEDVVGKNGILVDVRVYQKPPDREVVKYLTDQVIGRPKESMNIEKKVNFVLDDRFGGLPTIKPVVIEAAVDEVEVDEVAGELPEPVEVGDDR